MSLVASGEVSRVLRAADLSLLICPQVEDEALYLQDDSSSSRGRIEVRHLYHAGVATPAMLTDAEVELFVKFAAEVDDGEAQALAIAVSRRLQLATDDRRASRLAATLGVTVIDTPDLMLSWAPSTDRASVSAALTQIELRAHYIPRTTHPRRKEWDHLRGTR